MPRKNGDDVFWMTETRNASMRPRPDAAEKPQPQRSDRPLRAGFNEAAARCRGKTRGAGAPVHRPGRFNEAAARCRGKTSGNVAAAAAGAELQ